MDDFLTSAQAAALLGVSASTIKRWVDDGSLTAERTAGGHRRVRRGALRALQQRLGSASGAEAAARGDEDLLQLLLGDAPAREVEARLLALRNACGSAGAFAEALAPQLRALGVRWQRGEIGIADEHYAAERLARGLARLVEWLPLAAGAPRALLATAAGDEHTLGLALVEVCLREAGWATRWIGSRTPTAALVETIRSGPPVGLVAMSASAASTDAASLRAQELAVGRACAAASATLLIGGGGAWPRRPRYARLAVDFLDVERIGRLLLDKTFKHP